jgi:hypothetical protein
MSEPKFKIIGVSNFDNETVSDTLVCEGMTQYWAKAIFNDCVGKLNTEYDYYFYKIVPQDYKLYKWEP